MAASLPWTCPTCDVIVATRFCANCGEEPLKARELTLRGFAEKLFHAMTSIDARAARSAWSLVRRPGELTRSWSRGVRKPFVGPIQLFLIANVLFFGVQWLTGQNIFSSSLDSHLHHQDWSDLAQSLVARRLASTQITLAQYQPMFDEAVVLNAKSLIVLMTIAFALSLPLVFLRERRPFIVHVVFSLHLYAFLLLVFCLALAGAKLSSLLGLGGLETPLVDNILSLANLVACSIYLLVASGTAYAASGAARVVKTIALTLTVAVLVLGYRFVLLLITLYTT
jgi:hypothetical protein